MSLTTDPNDPLLSVIKDNGQQAAYRVLSDEELAKGFVRPVRYSYTHIVCGVSTQMDGKICETYARDPSFYGGTFCVRCGKHFPLMIDGQPQFLWDEDKTPVGS